MMTELNDMELAKVLSEFDKGEKSYLVESEFMEYIHKEIMR